MINLPGRNAFLRHFMKIVQYVKCVFSLIFIGVLKPCNNWKV